MRFTLKKPAVFFFASVLLLTLTTPAAANSLTIAVAANVQFAFKDLQAAFTRETGIDVQTIIGSSGKITAQVRSGAPFDVFLSADMHYPQTLHKEGLASRAPITYAYGTLVLWTMSDIDLTPGLKVLADPKVHKVAIADPKLAPYGRAALQALAHYQIADSVHAKAVFGENVSQVNQYIYSQNVDAGFTAKSVVLSPAMRGKGHWIEAPQDSYQAIAQGVVILKHGTDNAEEDCKRFVNFLTSAAARTILANYGYRLP
jgi:molybdate transport system substrate-binding protein